MVTPSCSSLTMDCLQTRTRKARLRSFTLWETSPIVFFHYKIVHWEARFCKNRLPEIVLGLEEVVEMALKALFLISILVVGCVVPMVQGQLLGLLGLLRIQGILYCTANGNVGVNGTTTPVFPSKLKVCLFMFPRFLDKNIMIQYHL